MPPALSIVVDEGMKIRRFSELNDNCSHYPPDCVLGLSLLDFRLLIDGLDELIEVYWPWVVAGHSCRVIVNHKLSGREMVTVTPIQPPGWANLTLYSNGRGKDAVTIHKTKNPLPTLQLPGAS
jgi:hypothetical protein